MMKNVIYKDWGICPYNIAWERQKNYLNEVVETRDTHSPKNYLVLCEHPNVYTLGRNGDENNLLIDRLQLMGKEVEFFKVDRGGDITYHGKGQIVGYPIVDLSYLNIGIREYIYRMEQSIIDVLSEYGIEGERLEGASGVWLDVGKQSVRKICAIGVRVSRQVTMHGFAFNINTDLSFFNYINPCGFQDKGVTSLGQELGKIVDLGEVKGKVCDALGRHFGVTIV